MAQIDRRKAVRITIGFVLGLAFGVGAARLVVSVAERLGTADVVGLFVALLLVASGAFSLLAGTNAATYARLAADVEPGERADAGMIRFARRAGVVNLLAGLLFAVPPLAAALALPAATMTLVYAAIVVLVGVESVVNINLWRDGDELVRAVVMRSGAFCFWIMQGLFFLWAAAERMALVDPVGSWTLLVVLMGTYLVTATVVSVRSGLGSS